MNSWARRSGDRQARGAQDRQAGELRSRRLL